jgi:hypothetical protein
LFGCCASTTAPLKANVKAMANITTHFGPRGRFCIAVRGAAFRLSEKDFEGNTFIGLFSWLSSTHYSLFTVT